MQITEKPDKEGGWLTCLFTQMGRAAEAGNAPTARLTTMLAVLALAMALIIAISR
jgi:hypothetical protein